MDSSPIITTSSRITDEIFLVDVNQYSFPQICSMFILRTPESIIIMDRDQVMTLDLFWIYEKKWDCFDECKII